MLERLELAREWINNGRSDLAERELRRHLAGSPEDGAAYGLLAVALISLRREGEAMLAAREAARLSPHHPWAVQALVEVHVRTSTPEAEAIVRTALERYPTEPVYHARLAAALMRRRARRSEARRLALEALAAAEAGLALDPGHLECLRQRAQALVRLGRVREARKASAAALRASPGQASSHAVHATVQLASGDAKRALQSLREALRIDPVNESAREQLGHLDGSRFNAAVELQLKTWAWPLYAVLAVSLVVVPLTLMRDLSTPGLPNGFLSLLAPLALFMPGVVLRIKHRGALDELRRPGALRSDELRHARIYILFFLFLFVANLLLAWVA